MIVTVALLVIGGIAGALYVIGPPEFLTALINPKPSVQVFDTRIIDEQIILSSGKNRIVQIYTSDAEAVLLDMYARNAEAKVAVSVSYYSSYEQQKNKTSTEQRLDYIIDFGTPLNTQIIPDQNSKVIVKLSPLSQSDLNVKISLRHETTE